MISGLLGIFITLLFSRSLDLFDSEELDLDELSFDDDEDGDLRLGDFEGGVLFLILFLSSLYLSRLSLLFLSSLLCLSDSSTPRSLYFLFLSLSF